MTTIRYVVTRGKTTDLLRFTLRIKQAGGDGAAMLLTEVPMPHRDRRKGRPHRSSVPRRPERRRYDSLRRR